jgi:hypothetical protein
VRWPACAACDFMNNEQEQIKLTELIEEWIRSAWRGSKKKKENKPK